MGGASATICVVDAGDGGDDRRDGLPWVDELGEGRDLAAAVDAHGADLGDLGEARRAAGGLQVDHREGDVGEVVALGAPLGEADVQVALPGEALVVAHEVAHRACA